MVVATSHIIDVASGQYPASLRRLARPPGQLWLRGTLENFQAISKSYRRVAIVGSRAAATVDAKNAEALAQQLAQVGIAVISGGALGIDAAAHRGSLRAGGLTCAVLGCGVDLAYPDRHAGLFDAIARTGAVISQFPLGAAPLAGAFVTRNATIAALADAVVMVGAAQGSGALHTVRAAAALGMPVLAMPGAPACDAMLAAGTALPCRDAGDVLAVLEGRYEVALLPVSHAAAGTVEHAVLAVLADGVPRDEAAIAHALAMTPIVVRRALLELELESAVEMVASSKYRRAQRREIRHVPRPCASK